MCVCVQKECLKFGSVPINLTFEKLDFFKYYITFLFIQEMILVLMGFIIKIE